MEKKFRVTFILLVQKECHNPVAFGFWLASEIPAYLRESVRPFFFKKDEQNFVRFGGLNSHEFKSLMSSLLKDDYVQVYKVEEEKAS